MMTRGRKRIVFTAVVACISLGVAHHRASSQTPFGQLPPKTSNLLNMQPDELQLHGTIGGFSKEDGIIHLVVDSFTFPRDKERRLSSRRVKLIRLSEANQKILDLDRSAEISLADLKAGRRASVIGIDMGWRKEFVAREVRVSGPKVSGLNIPRFGEIDERDLAIAKQQEQIVQLQSEIEQLKGDIQKLKEK